MEGALEEYKLKAGLYPMVFALKFGSPLTIPQTTVSHFILETVIWHRRSANYGDDMRERWGRMSVSRQLALDLGAPPNNMSIGNALKNIACAGFLAAISPPACVVSKSASNDPASSIERNKAIADTKAKHDATGKHTWTGPNQRP